MATLRFFAVRTGFVWGKDSGRMQKYDYYLYTHVNLLYSRKIVHNCEIEMQLKWLLF